MRGDRLSWWIRGEGRRADRRNNRLKSQLDSKSKLDSKSTLKSKSGGFYPSRVLLPLLSSA